ncbi:MAG: hypothetical protein RMK99_04805 [Anaerolineales bacterium]|nr:hypothetical protein [Anaerolineales bacterium]
MNLSVDLIGGVVGFALTLMVLSYLIADNPLYRIALHLFVGMVAGFVVVTVTLDVFVPQLMASSGSGWITVVGLVLAALLTLKMFSGGSNLGRLPLAYLVGLGAAVAVGGAITGTLLPQTRATWFALGGDLSQLISNILIFVGTACTLLAFHYGARAGAPAQQSAPLRALALAGQFFISITFGVIYAGALAGGVSYLAERISFLWEFLTRLLAGA